MRLHTDSKGRQYDQVPGFRVNGPRKTRMINIANLHMTQLGAKGVNVMLLLRILGVTGDSMSITTKQWSGVISGIRQFRRDNRV